MRNDKLTENYKKFVSDKIRGDISTLCLAYKDMGYECYLVGGSIRDLIQGKRAHDYDFATNCPLEETKERFEKVIPTGEDHGTLTIKAGNSLFEVTRYRKDVETDGRRATVKFSDTVEEDLARRDFTSNAIAYNPLNGQVVDPYDGIDHLEKHILCFVGDAETRIKEDHLRALRFVRFSTGYYKLDEDPDDWGTVVDTFDEKILSQERINEEVQKILDRLNDFNSSHQRQEVIQKFQHLRIYERFGSDKLHEAIRIMVELRDSFPIAYWVGQTKGIDAITEELKYPASSKVMVKLFLEIKTNNFGNSCEVKETLYRVNKYFQKSLVFPVVVDMFNYIEAFYPDRDLYTARKLVYDIRKNKEPYLISHLDVSGGDVIKAGYEGVQVGQVLYHILEKVWNDPGFDQWKELGFLERLRTMEW